MDKSQIPSKYGYWARSSFDHARIREEFAQTYRPGSYPNILVVGMAARYDRASWYFLFLDEFYKTEHEE